MIQSTAELNVTMERIMRFQKQVIAIRENARTVENYRASASGYLAEIDRMMLEVRDYLWSAPAGNSEVLATA